MTEGQYSQTLDFLTRRAEEAEEALRGEAHLRAGFEEGERLWRENAERMEAERDRARHAIDQAIAGLVRYHVMRSRDRHVDSEAILIGIDIELRGERDSR